MQSRQPSHNIARHLCTASVVDARAPLFSEACTFPVSDDTACAIHTHCELTTLDQRQHFEPHADIARAAVHHQGPNRGPCAYDYAPFEPIRPRCEIQIWLRVGIGQLGNAAKLQNCSFTKESLTYPSKFPLLLSKNYFRNFSSPPPLPPKSRITLLQRNL